MKPIRVAVVLFVLGSLLGCGKEAAVKLCNEQCATALKEAEAKCVGAGAETCKSVLKANAATCTQTCASAKGGSTKIRF